MPVGDLIILRSGPAAAWASINPVLADGEPGVAIDGTTVVFKVGNGVTAWNDLPIANAVALSEFLGTTANQAAMLALSGNRGDWTIRTDEQATYILTGEPSSSLGNWQKLPTPTDAVSSVNGRTGAVTGLAEATSVTTEASTRASADTALDTSKASKASVRPIIVERTSGDITLAISAVFIDSDTTGTAAARTLDLVFPGAQVGDVITVEPNIYLNSSAGPTVHTFATIVNGAVVHRAGGAFGVPTWSALANTIGKIVGAYSYVVQTGDVEAGAVRVRLQHIVTSATRTMKADTNTRFYLEGRGPFG